jgi:tripartite-type tricarboxylate transporter receptor subunit TctC
MKARLGWMLFSTLLWSAAGAGAAERPFYQGKTLTFVINFAPGGPTDVEGRLIARHLAKHIPGQPSIIVQNMAGAGGVIAVNWLGEVAKPDGLSLGYFTGSLFHQQLKNPALRVNLARYPFIAGLQGITVCYIRSDVPPGIKKPTDLVKAQRFRAGGLSFDSSKDVRFRLAFDLLGLKYDYVTGYNSSSEARLAVQRGEIHYHDETLPSYRSIVEPQMVKAGLVTSLYYHDIVSPEGEVRGSPDVPELPSFTQLHVQLFGRPPAGIKYEALKAANMSSTNMSRVVLLPPGSPPEAAAAMRQAFAALANDREFLDQAMKVTKFHPRFELGQEAERLYQRIVQAPPEILEFLRDFIEQARKK